MNRDGHPETYLGDGVYAWSDGYQIWLRADRDGRSHEIALDAGTFENLTEFNRRVWKLSEKASVAFVEAPISPPEPNNELKAAAARFKDQQS